MSCMLLRTAVQVITASIIHTCIHNIDLLGNSHSIEHVMGEDLLSFNGAYTVGGQAKRRVALSAVGETRVAGMDVFGRANRGFAFSLSPSHVVQHVVCVAQAGLQARRNGGKYNLQQNIQNAHCFHSARCAGH